MELAKTNRMNDLLEFYGKLLTDKQQSYLELYYGDDYSLGEIAEDFGVSRQAVYDNIRRSAAALEEYEGKLHLLEKFTGANDAVDTLAKYLHDQYPDDSHLRHLLGKVQQQVAR
ncbi:putative DNA-binding protein [Lacticaseibacillus pabuli]|uniref:UPF0122 protein PQ472_05520 n=1 Tax=Lacticaseibacillus pabuli TaxID=3025672 RepID=A0ABY7X0K7_9LACO|nr:putative DNA-binding protein [Lacticaseibacillus sp. KACC 23028]WDF83695.1 putative DNA-binding protein [Lacticaseibacillus sp. KACC 23028]